MKQAGLFVVIPLTSALFIGWNRVGARSLATGQGYRIVNYPGEPFQMKYTPLFTALLSIAWKLGAVFSRNVRCAALLVWLMMMPFYVLLGLRIFSSVELGHYGRNRV